MNNRKKKEKTSQYKGVHWHKKSDKWYAHLLLRTGKQKFGGTFKDELDAAKRVNQLCKEMELPLQNPGIFGIPTQQYWYHKREKTSQYKGVSFHSENGKWYAFLHLKAGKKKFGGSFNDELEAAKRVNQLCEELGIALQNPGVIEVLNLQSLHDDYQTTTNSVIINSSDILQTDYNDAKKKKRKRTTEFNADDKLPIKTYYFYEDLLK